MMNYVVKAIRKEETYQTQPFCNPSLANYYFDKCIADGYEDVELYDAITGEPFQKYTITEDEEGDVVENIWTAREFYNLI